jgi:hypothetical protein
MHRVFPDRPLRESTDVGSASVKVPLECADEERGATLRGPIMKSFVRATLLGAAGLVALSLPGQALTTGVTDIPVFKSSTKPLQLAERGYDPSAGSVGFKKSKRKAKKKS